MAADLTGETRGREGKMKGHPSTNGFFPRRRGETGGEAVVLLGGGGGASGIQRGDPGGGCGHLGRVW
jgi:hypothetical protein